MKKLLVLTALVLFLSSLIALESDPSDVVGFVKIAALNNIWTYHSLPFDLDGDNVSVIYSDGSGNPYITGGTNPGNSDQITEYGGSSAWYNTGSSAWMGDYAVDISKPHLAKIINGDADIYACGTVDNSTSVNYGNVPAGFWTYISYREAGEVSVENLGLLSAGFTGGTNPGNSDQITEYGGASAWYNTNTSAWMGSFNIIPGKVYILKILSGHSGLTNYSYPPGGAREGTQKSVISKIKIHSNMK